MIVLKFFIWHNYSGILQYFQVNIPQEHFAERCPSWLKERDWKSRVLLTGGTEGSNPSLSASFYYALRGDENRVFSRSVVRPVKNPRTRIKG